MQLRAALITALILIIGLCGLNAQMVSDYSFAKTTNGSLTNMSSSTTDIFSTGVERIDQSSGVNNIGFTFRFAGTNYTQFSLNTNGQIRLGGTAINTANADPGANIAYLLPFYSAANSIRVRTNSQIHFRMTGSSPNRVTTIEYKDVLLPYSSAFSTNTSTFQVRLYESSNRIEFVYGTMRFQEAAWDNLAIFGLSHSNTFGTVSTVLQPNNASPLFVSRDATWGVSSFATVTTITGLSSTADGSRVVLSFTPPASGAILNPLSVTSSSPNATTNAFTWVKNAAQNWAMITVHTGEHKVLSPVNGTSYPLGTSVPGGATVIFRTGETSFSHTNLQPATDYYYTFWSWDSNYVYSKSLSFVQRTANIPPPSYTTSTNAPASIDFNITPNSFSHPVLILQNNSGQFSHPQNGVQYQAGDMIGTSTVIYDGYTTFFRHENLNPSTLYVYNVYSRMGLTYSEAVGDNNFTWSSIPIFENFNTVPGISIVHGNMQYAIGRGLNGSMAMRSLLGFSGSSAYLQTRMAGPLPQDIEFSFYYRLLSQSGYPNVAHVMTGTDRIEIGVSSGIYNPFTTIAVFNASDHIPSTEYRKLSFPIPQALIESNLGLRFQVRVINSTGAFYAEIDNFEVAQREIAPEISLSHQSIDFGDVGIYAVSEARDFSITNTGGGSLTLSEAPIIQGTDALHFALYDTNTYPVSLDENQSISFQIAMRPETLGVKNAVLSFSDDLERASYNIPLTGISTDVYHSGGGNSESQAGGYFYANNLALNAPSSPVFNWLDPGSDPIVSGPDFGTYANGSWGPIPIGFGFSFFGDTHHELYINTNGTISFAAPNLISENSVLPSGTLPNNLIALFWDELQYFPGISQMHIDSNATSLSITFTDFGKAGIAYDPQSTITAQLIIYANGRIKKQYQRVLGDWTPTIGLENADGTLGIQYHFNGIGGAYRTNLRNSGIAIIYGDDPHTLPVELSSFNAIYSANNLVNLYWTVESLTNHLGFNVYRNAANDLDTAIRINNHLISEGNATGSSIRYRFEDRELQGASAYWYWLQSIDLDGSHRFYGPVFATAEEQIQDTPGLPIRTDLYPATPNPFNPSTRLGYSISKAADVSINIYNSKGQLLRSFKRSHDNAGHYSVTWDGKDNSGNHLASGIYFYRMQSEHYTFTRKMLMMK